MLSFAVDSQKISQVGSLTKACGILPAVANDAVSRLAAQQSRTATRA